MHIPMRVALLFSAGLYLAGCGATAPVLSTSKPIISSPAPTETPTTKRAEEKEEAQKPEKGPSIPQELPFGFKSQILPPCDAKVATTDEPYEEKEGTWKQYSVLICDIPPLDFRGRVGFGLLIHSQKLAHSSMWIKFMAIIEKDRWGTIHYRIPRTENDFEVLKREGIGAFEQKIGITGEGLPLVISLIPEEMREKHILFFLAYYQGSYEIFFLDNTKDVALMMARIINDELRKYRAKHKKP